MPETDVRSAEIVLAPAAEPHPAPHFAAPAPDGDRQAQIAFHRQQESFHAERAAFHDQERARHRQALAVLAPTQPPLWLKPPTGSRLPLADWVARLIEQQPGDQLLTATYLAGHLNRLAAPYLEQPIDSRQVSLALRRFAAGGHLRLVRRGGSHREAVYGRRVG